MEVHDYHELMVWQRAMDLAVVSYRLADQLPAWERYGLGGQLRRAASSVPANIAEGNGRTHRRAYLSHLSIARGSLKELGSHIHLARRVGHLRPEECAEAHALATEVSRLLTALIRALSQ